MRVSGSVRVRALGLGYPCERAQGSQAVRCDTHTHTVRLAVRVSGSVRVSVATGHTACALWLVARDTVLRLSMCVVLAPRGEDGWSIQCKESDKARVLGQEFSWT